MPKAGNNIIEFKDFMCKEPSPFCVYADLECLLIPMQRQVQTMNTTIDNRHEMFSIGLYFNNQIDVEKSYYTSYSGKECAKWFVSELVKIREYIKDNFVSTIVPMKPLTTQQQHYHDTTNICHICEKVIEAGLSENRKIYDHNHLNGVSKQVLFLLLIMIITFIFTIDVQGSSTYQL